MTNFNFLLKSSSQSGSHRVVTLASTVGSPSVDRRGTMLKHVAFLLLFLYSFGVGNVWGECTTIATRTFLSSEWTQSISNYTSSWSDLDCSFYGAANNSKQYNYARLAVKGGSNTNSTKTSTCRIWYNNAINSKVSQVIINHEGTTDAIGGNLNINWVALSVYNGTTKVDSVTLSSSVLSFAKNDPGTITFTPTSGNTWNSGLKYRFYANIYCKGSSNRGLNVSSLQFDLCEDASCSNTIAISKGSENNGEITEISNDNVTTCSETNSERRVTITIKPDDCYDAPSILTYSGDGTATKQGATINNGDGTYSYVYQFAQNDNGTGTFGVTCTAKPAGKTVNFDAGPLSNPSSMTEDCDGSGITLPDLNASTVCKGWTTFAGWATAAVNDSNTTSGVTLYNAGDIFVPSSNGQTLYAVYSKSKGGGNGFKLSLKSNDYYVAPKSGTNNFFGYTDDPDKAEILYLDASNHLYFYAGNTLTYVSAANSTTMTFGTSNPTYAWNVVTTNGVTTLQTTESHGRYLAFNSDRFSSYGSSYDHEFTKHSLSTTYYCSDPTCCQPLASIKGSFSRTNLLSFLSLFFVNFILTMSKVVSAIFKVLAVVLCGGSRLAITTSVNTSTSNKIFLRRGDTPIDDALLIAIQIVHSIHHT